MNSRSAKYVFIMNLKLAMFLKDEYIQQTQKTVKGSHKITFKIAKMLDAKDIQSMPGFQLCRSCFEEAQTHCHDVSKVEDYDIASDSYSSEALQTRTAEEDPCEKHPEIDHGGSLQSISISPIKTDSMPKHVKVSYACEKVGKAMSTLKQSFAQLLELKKICARLRTQNCLINKKEIKRK